MNQIGRYEILNEIGKGAFGRVYRGYDPYVKRPVAIKVLSSDIDFDMLARFEAEAGMTANLLHKNIVTVYEFSQHEGTPYLVMELLEGKTLQQILSEAAPLSLLDKVDIMYQVAEGLQLAHSKGVIHRDIKPGNIMVLPNGTAKIMDFGIARVLDPDATRRTRKGDVVGTVLYMAPEQFNGFDADKRTDIFSFGVIFYELITGNHPFQAKDLASALYRITSFDPPSLIEAVPGCPEGLDTMVPRLMAKDRDMRIDKFEEVLLDSLPILQALRQERATSIAQELPALIKARNFDAAQAKIRQALEFDPSNKEARHWREQLKREAQAAALRTRIAELIREGREHLEARRFPEALQTLDSALGLDPGNFDTQAAIARARHDEKAAREAGRLVAAARGYVQRDDLETALEKIAEARQMDPAHPEAALLHTATQELLARKRVGALLSEAEHYRAQEEFAEALAVLDSAERQYQSAASVVDFRNRIKREQAESESRKRDAQARRENEAKFRRDLDRARKHLQSGQFEQAGDILTLLRQSMLAEHELDALLRQVEDELFVERRKRSIRQIVEQTRALLEKKHFDDAIRMFREGLKVYGSEPELTELLDDASAKKAEHVQKIQEQEIARLAGPIETAILEDRWQDALSLLAKAESAYPAQLIFEDLLQRAKAVQSRVQADEAKRDIASRKTEIGRAISDGRFADAFSLLGAARQSYPSDADFDQLNDDARRAQEQARADERNRQIARLRIEIEAALAAADLDQTSSLISAARREFPKEPLFQELFSRLNDLVKRRQLNELVASIAQALTPSGDVAVAEMLLGRASKLDDQDSRVQQLGQVLGREKKYRSCMEHASRELERGKFDEAASAAHEALKHRDQDWDAHELLKIIESRRFQAEEEQHCKSSQNAVKTLLRNKQYEEAAAKAREFLIRFPRDAEFEKLLQAGLAGAQQISPARHVWPMYVIGGISAVAIAVILIFLPWGLPSLPTARLNVKPAALGFEYVEGEEVPASQTIEATADKRKTILEATVADSWVRVDPVSAEVPATFRVSVDPSGQPAGRHQSRITVKVLGQTTLSEIPIGMTVKLKPRPEPQQPETRLTVVPSQISFDYLIGGTVPSAQRVGIGAEAGQAEYRAQSSARWLSISPSHGSAPSRADVTVKPEGLAKGVYSEFVVVAPSTGKGPGHRVNVSLTVREAPPTLGPKPAELTAPPPPPPAWKPRPYSGPGRGRITWSGVLPPDGRIVLEPTAQKDGPGASEGQYPGDVRITAKVDSPDGVVMEVKPDEGNHYNKIVLVNKSSVPVNSIIVSWSVLK